MEIGTMTDANKKFINFEDFISNNDYDIRNAAILATFLDIRYGEKAGNIACSTYSFLKREPYPTHSFRKDAPLNTIPHLDCSGFVSWIFNITNNYKGPMNSSKRNLESRNDKRPKSTGNWNIWAKCRFPEHALFKPGDLLFLPSHVMIITDVVDQKIFGLSHSRYFKKIGGVEYLTDQKMINRYLKSSEKASAMVGENGPCIGRFEVNIN